MVAIASRTSTSPVKGQHLVGSHTASNTTLETLLGGKFMRTKGILIIFLLLLSFIFVVFESMVSSTYYFGVRLDSNPEQTSSSTITSLFHMIQDTPLGALGPKGTSRENLRYYDSLFLTAVQFGRKAKSAVEVGCAMDPFLQYLSWMETRTCIAPYFVDYNNKSSSSSSSNSATNHGHENLTTTNNQKKLNMIQSIQADFMDYPLLKHPMFDLLICSQVVEHVDQPKEFVQKLIQTATISIISVPYLWEDCGKVCNHKTHRISYEMMLEWSAPYVPVYSAVVMEKGASGPDHRRMIVVFDLGQDVEN